MRRISLLIGLLLAVAVPLSAGAAAAEAASLPSLIAFDYHEGIGIVRPGHPGSEHVIARRTGRSAWSPNGKKLAYRDQQGIHVASASGAHPRLVSHLVPSTLSWAPDSKDLVISYTGPPANNGNNDLFELSLPSGRLKQYTNTGDDETDPSWAQAVTARPPRRSSWQSKRKQRSAQRLRNHAALGNNVGGSRPPGSSILLGAAIGWRP